MPQTLQPAHTETGSLYYLEEPLKLAAVQVIQGANIYYRSTVMRAVVSIDALAKAEVAAISERLAQDFLLRFGALRSFLPNNGMDQGIVTRLENGQQVALEELLLEAVIAVESACAFARHELGQTAFAEIRQQGEQTIVLWSSHEPQFSKDIMHIALQGILELLPPALQGHKIKTAPAFEALFNALIERARRRRLAPSTAIIKLHAQQRGIPCEIVGRQQLRLGYGKQQRGMYASMTDSTSMSAQKLSADKRLTRRRLKELRLPVPRQAKTGSIEVALERAQKLGFPVVVKPVRGRKGCAVTVGIQSAAEVADAFQLAHQKGSDVLVEQFIAGHDYRLLVAGGRFVAALRRCPPAITGDGRTTISGLIDVLNEDPYRDGFRGFKLTHDAEMQRLLERAGYQLGDILPEGEKLVLRAQANVSTGGLPQDVTDQVHPDNQRMAERAAVGVGLDVAGVDFITEDISRSYRETGGAIIEVNARPGLDIHVWPKYGQPRNVAQDILNLSFPSEQTGRIPVIAVAGDKGTGSCARILDMILRGAGQTVGLAMRARSYINGQSAELSDLQQQQAPLMLLRAPEIEMLVSTVSPRLTARNGMLLEDLDVTIVMDRVKPGQTEAFHQGLDVVCDATSSSFVVGAGNLVALNKIASLQNKQIILVDRRANHPDIQQHLKNGGCAVSEQWADGKICAVLLQGDQQLASFSVDVSSSRDGRLRQQRLRLALLYALGAAYASGMSLPELQQALAHAPTMVPAEEETE